MMDYKKLQKLKLLFSALPVLTVPGGDISLKKQVSGK